MGSVAVVFFPATVGVEAGGHRGVRRRAMYAARVGDAVAGVKMRKGGRSLQLAMVLVILAVDVSSSALPRV